MQHFFKRNFSINPDFEPHSIIKVISRNGEAVKQQSKQEKKVVHGVEKTAAEKRPNVNEMGIQMISKQLFQQIFKNAKPVKIEPEYINR